MKVSHVLQLNTEKIEIKDMKPGQVGIDEDGNYYYRTLSSAACLNSPGESYLRADGVGHLVQILPPGTTITLTLE